MRHGHGREFLLLNLSVDPSDFLHNDRDKRRVHTDLWSFVVLICESLSVVVNDYRSLPT